MTIPRAAIAILRTERPLSKDFRVQVAEMIEALDQLYSEALMTEQVHKRSGQPFYSKGLDMARALLGEKT